MTDTRPRPWPMGPLLEAAKCPNPTALGRKVSGSGSAVRIAAQLGLTDQEADRWAIRCGLHPAEVWPDWHAWEGAA